MADCFITKSISPEKSKSELMGYITSGLEFHYSADANHFVEGWRIEDLSGKGHEGIFLQHNSPVLLNSGGNFIPLKLSSILGSLVNFKNITLEIIVKINSTVANNISVISNHEGGGVAILCYGGIIKPNFFINDNYQSTTNGYLHNNEVHSYSATYDGKEMKFFVDGHLWEKYPIIGEIKSPNPDTYMAINANPSGGSCPDDSVFDIDFYSARIYNRALTENEITVNHNVDKNLFNIA